MSDKLWPEPEPDKLPQLLQHESSRYSHLDQVARRGEQVLSELCSLIELCGSDGNADLGRESLRELGKLLIQSEEILNWVTVWWHAADQQPVNVSSLNQYFPNALKMIICLSWRAWYCAAWILVGEKDQLTWQVMSAVLRDVGIFRNRWGVTRRAILVNMPTHVDETFLAAKLDNEHCSLRSPGFGYPPKKQPFVDGARERQNIKRNMPVGFSEMSDEDLVQAFDTLLHNRRNSHSEGTQKRESGDKCRRLGKGHRKVIEVLGEQHLKGTTIAKKANCTEGHARRLLAELVSWGYLKNDNTGYYRTQKRLPN